MGWSANGKAVCQMGVEIAQSVGPAHELAASPLWPSGLPMGKPYTHPIQHSKSLLGSQL